MNIFEPIVNAAKRAREAFTAPAAPSITHKTAGGWTTELETGRQGELSKDDISEEDMLAHGWRRRKRKRASSVHEYFDNRRYIRFGRPPIETAAKALVTSDPQRRPEEIIFTPADFAYLAGDEGHGGVKRINRFLHQVGGDRVKLQLNGNVDVVNQSIAKGDIEGITHPPVETRREIAERLAIARKALKRQRREIIARSVPILRRGAEVLIDLANVAHDELLAQEKATAEKFGVPFSPSQTLVVLGQIQWRIDEIFPKDEHYTDSIDGPLKKLGINLD